MSGIVLKRIGFLLALLPGFAVGPGEDVTAPPDEVRTYHWETPRDTAVRLALQKPLKEVIFDAQTLEKAIRAFSELTGLNVHVVWTALEVNGLERDAELTLVLRNVSAASALRAMLDEVSAGEVELEFEITDGRIRISTREELSQRTILVTHDCGDLLNAEERALGKYISRVFEETVKRTSRAVLDAPEVERLLRHVIRDTRAQLRRELIETVQKHIEPESWQDAGGKTGTISVANDKLVVSHRRSVQYQIADLITSLREQHGAYLPRGRAP